MIIYNTMTDLAIVHPVIDRRWIPLDSIFITDINHWKGETLTDPWGREFISVTHVKNSDGKIVSTKCQMKVDGQDVNCIAMEMDMWKY